MKGAAAFVGAGLMVVWPIPGDDIDRDAEIAAALPDLEAIAKLASSALIGTSTWRVLNPVDGIPGWEHWPGALLIATTPLETIFRGTNE